VQNNLTEAQVVERASSLSFPNSVIEYFQGYLGIPPIGFPEPLRSRVLEGKKLLPNGKNCFTARPGAEMPAYDFEAARKELEMKHGKKNIQEKDVVSYSQYPKGQSVSQCVVQMCCFIFPYDDSFCYISIIIIIIINFKVFFVPCLYDWRDVAWQCSMIS
jgi:pyruvate carboxylase